VPVFAREANRRIAGRWPQLYFAATPRECRSEVESAANRSRIAGLDGLRAIAILAVLLAHSLEVSVARSPSDARWIAIASKFGPFGVRLFFAISGYLITSLFLRELKAYGPVLALRMFYIRRVFRIVPPFLPYLAVLAIGGALWHWPIRELEIVRAGAFLGNYFPGSWLVNHFWSLAVEEHFYLFWPPLMALAGQSRSKWCCVAIVSAVAVLRTLTLARHPVADHSWLLLETHLILDFLVYAALLALLIRNPSIRRWLCAHARPAVLGGLLAMLLLVNLVAPRVTGFDPRSLEAMLFAFLVVLPSLRPEMTLVRWLEHPVLVWIGRRSYSIYIWQQLFLLPLGVTFLRNCEWFVPRLIPIFAVAALSYRFLEQPMMRQGRELAARLSKPAPQAASYSVTFR